MIVLVIMKGKNDQELITFSFKYDFLIVRHCFLRNVLKMCEELVSLTFGLVFCRLHFFSFQCV